MDYRELVERAKRDIREIEPTDLEKSLGSVDVLIDVREPAEHSLGAIQGSVLIPRGVLESTVRTQAPSTELRIVLYCEAGNRSALAAKTLADMGYGDVTSLAGGFERWKREGLPWRAPQALSIEQRVRYDRHLKLPEVGEAGQAKLLDARVLIIGAGGLGSPAAMYLAAAGVGTIGIADGDVVDASNLQRQVIHSVDRIGRLKVDSAAVTIASINPDVKVEQHPMRLTAANILEVLGGYDLVVDGADNFPTRYLVNDASLHLGKPVVHGSIFRFEGQATTFTPYEGPCYRCLFALPPPPELAPSCAEAGVLGALPGMIGSIQAIEALKLILGTGEPLVGRLVMYDALEQHFTTLQIPRDPNCAACSDPGAPPLLVDYDEACAPAAANR